jgi:hypothetical protein
MKRGTPVRHKFSHRIRERKGESEASLQEQMDHRPRLPCIQQANSAGAEVSKCMCTRHQVSKKNSLSSAIIINCVSIALTDLCPFSFVVLA